ncbi:MAG: DUF4258 domain-containing protein [Chloroflexi bacterium]|nr:DUF4258 domain-containing protein [Chloroflexota bacterium]
MSKQDVINTTQQAVRTGQIKISLHAAEEAVAEDIHRTEILEALSNITILEEYPNWWLGPCCLLYGQTHAGRNLHIVSSYQQLPITIITLYEPKPPKWITPTKRGGTP